MTESRLPKLQIAKIPEVQVLSDKESDAENIDESPIEVIGEQAPEIALEPSTTERNVCLWLFLLSEIIPMNKPVYDT